MRSLHRLFVAIAATAGVAVIPTFLAGAVFRAPGARFSPALFTAMQLEIGLCILFAVVSVATSWGADAPRPRLVKDDGWNRRAFELPELPR